MHARRRLPSASMIVAIIALVFAATGGAVAAISGVGSITGIQIQNGSVQEQDLSAVLRKKLEQAIEVKKNSVDYGDITAKAKQALLAQAQKSAQQSVQQALAQFAATPGPQGPAGPQGGQGPAGLVPVYTSNAGSAHLTGATSPYSMASLSLPAGTWVLLGHFNAVTNDSVNPERLDCYFQGADDDFDLAKQRVQANSGGTSSIYADLNLQAVTTLAAPATVTAYCGPTGASPDWTFNSRELMAIQVSSVVRQ